MKLPTVEVRPSRGARPSAAVARPSDMGLGAAARGLEEWAGEVEETRALEEQVARTEAEENVRPILERFTTEAEAEFNEAGAAWDGVEPGFARRQGQRLTERRTGFGDDLPLTSIERDALTRGVNLYTEASGQRAIQYEGQRRGALNVQAAAAREGAVIGRLTGDYMTALAEQQSEIDETFDGSTDDYEVRLLTAHDAAAAAAIEAAPEHLKARVTQQMQRERLQVQARAMEVQARGQMAYVTGQVRQAGDRTLNALIGAPGLYEQSVAQVEDVVAPLPAAARAPERARLLDGYTDVYIGGLIDRGEEDQAIALLEGGTLDARLSPDTKARLMTLAVRKREEPDANDMIAALQADQLMKDNLASVAATGTPIAGATPQDLAAVLSPAELARYTLDIETAKRVHAATPGFGGMTEAEIAAHVAGLEPQPGQAGFAEAQQRHSLAQQEAAREIKAREEDPAAWAMSAAPALRGSLAGLGEGDLTTRRRAAATYAAGQMTVQAEAAIPEAERRVLPKTAAAEIVQRAEQDPDPANGLRGLAAVLEAFEPPTGATASQLRDGYANRNRVIAELKAAGGDAGDIAAALDLGNDPVRLGRYVAATRGEALEKMEGRDKSELERVVDRQLEPYLASFAGVPASRELTEGRRLMAQRLAAERAAGGRPGAAAAREAVEVVAGQYRFVGPTGWRMPARMAERRDPESGASQQRTAEVGASRLLGALMVNDGSGLYTPADNGRGMSAEQRRRRYADTVGSRGRWFATADDSGLVLMTPNLDGGWTPALNSEGRPIAHTWGGLVNAGRSRPTQGQREGGLAPRGRQPRGIRNNNPGNIEFRSANPWRGQTGSDGRFATFSTPEAGVRALAIDLGTKSRRGLTSVQSILNAYAPESENDTAAYVRAVSRSLGVGPTQRLDLSDPRIRAGLIGAIISHENGMQPYSNDMIGRIAVEVARSGR